MACETEHRFLSFASLPSSPTRPRLARNMLVHTTMVVVDDASPATFARSVFCCPTADFQPVEALPSVWPCLCVVASLSLSLSLSVSVFHCSSLPFSLPLSLSPSLPSIPPSLAGNPTVCFLVCRSVSDQIQGDVDGRLFHM